jgi:hypothetical protein
MFKKGIYGIAVAAIVFAVSPQISLAQGQSDPQAGAQLGEQSALGGKENQAANTQKTEKSASGETSLAAGTTINAELTNALDSKKVKQGDAVNARASETLKSTDGRIIVPKGAKLTGHVTQASARSAGQTDSTLGLTLEKAMLKNGQEIPLNVAIQAIAAPASGAEANQPTEMSSTGVPSGTNRGTGMGSNGTAGTVNNTRAAAGSTVDNTVNSTAGVARNTTEAVTGADQLNANSHGVVWLNNLSLSTTAGGSAQGSVITSTGKNVHLDSGTRLVLVTQASAASN